MSLIVTELLSSAKFLKEQIGKLRIARVKSLDMDDDRHLCFLERSKEPLPKGTEFPYVTNKDGTIPKYVPVPVMVHVIGSNLEAVRDYRRGNRAAPPGFPTIYLFGVRYFLDQEEVRDYLKRKEENFDL